MFYAIYESAGESPISTVPREDLTFPPALTYKGKSYRLIRTMQVNTPNQKKTFDEYCNNHSITQDITL